MSVCSHMCQYVQVRGQFQVSSSTHSTLFLRQRFPWSSPICLDWLVSKCLGSTSVALGLQMRATTPCHSELSPQALGTRTQNLMLAWQTLTTKPSPQPCRKKPFMEAFHSAVLELKNSHCQGPTRKRSRADKVQGSVS